MLLFHNVWEFYTKTHVGVTIAMHLQRIYQYMSLRVVHSRRKLMVGMGNACPNGKKEHWENRLFAKSSTIISTADLVYIYVYRELKWICRRH